MKVTIDRTGDDVHISLERDPLPPERFSALCKLARATIGGAVFLGVVYLAGFWVVPWAVAALVAVGLYKLMKDF